MPIMKTIAKFETNAVKLTFEMCEKFNEENHEELYVVKVQPKHKNAGWYTIVKEFAFSKDANEYIMQEIKFWLC